MFEELIRSWEGEEVVVGFDRPSGSWMFVCIHSTTRGPADGGTRMKTYSAPSDALADAMRLAGAMTLKMAAIDMPFGGAKAVLSVPALPAGNERRRLFLRFGELAASLGPMFRTAPDLNTTTSDMDVIGERHRYVYCRSEEYGGSGDPGPQTAHGVFHGIRASLERVFGSPELEGRTVLVQGAGNVGAPLAERLAAAGTRVLVSDVDRERAHGLAERISAIDVPPDDAVGVDCDVYAPCALGGVLNAETIRKLRCRVVAGSANNQLETPADAERLRAAGILYAPDFVINAGGVLYSAGVEALGWDLATVEMRLAEIGDTLAQIYARADAEQLTTHAAAEDLARARLQAGRP
jgi:leucine dehydrogenase